MFKILKRILELRLRYRRLKYIDKQYSKYLGMKARTKAQRRYVDDLISRYNEVYGDDLSLTKS